MTGATGLVGSALTASLALAGHRVSTLVRGGGPHAANEIGWDPNLGRIDAARLEGLDAVIHLAGESIASGRWTAARKERIRASRVVGTTLLAKSLAALRDPPRVLLSASAVGFYGDRGDTPVDETSSAGSGFLAGICTEWEAATAPASVHGIRVAHLRFGVILSAKGGALAKMLPAFRLGVGGPVGHGQQVLSWVSLSDVIAAIEFTRTHEALAGAVNLVAPQPVTSRDFARALGRVVHRPALLPLPAFAIRAAFGEMGQALLLSGCRVVPRRLLDAGFPFRDAEIEGALRRELGKTAS